MAIIKVIHCTVCGQDSKEYHPSGYAGTRTICFSCVATAESVAKQQFLAERAAMTVEQRLALLEDFVYDHLQVRHGYLPEPRY